MTVSVRRRLRRALLSTAVLAVASAPHATPAAPPGAKIFTIAGRDGIGDGEAAKNARIIDASGIWPHPAGGFIVVDQLDYRIRRIDASGVISTIGGSGIEGYSGDGGPALSAKISFAEGVTVDSSGVVYFADSNDRVRKIDASGNITTVAGTGIGGYSGDGGPATAAKISLPRDVAVDSSGNLYIADRGNDRVRRVDAVTGIITTFAGGGTGDGTSGPATGAAISYPDGLAFDASGNLYISAAFSQAVFRVTPAGLISKPMSGIFAASDVAVDTPGNLYVLGDGQIFKRDTGGTVTTVAGSTDPNVPLGDGGPALDAWFDARQIAIDVDGNLVMTDRGHVRRVDLSSGIIDTIAGPRGDGGSALNAYLNQPGVIDFDPSGRLLVPDYTTFANQTLRAVDTSGTITSIWGDRNPPEAIPGWVPITTTAVTSDSSGNIFAIDYGLTAIAELHTDGTAESIFVGGPPHATNRFQDLAVDGGGDTVYWTATFNDQIPIIKKGSGFQTPYGDSPCDITAGNFHGDGGQASDAGLCRPIGLDVDKQGNLYIADSLNFRIRKVTPAGVISTIAGNGTRFGTPDGDGGPATDATLGMVSQITVDAKGNVFIAEDNRIRRIGADGKITSYAGTGAFGFSGDGGLALDATFDGISGLTTDADGNVYVSDQNNSRIRLIVDPANFPIFSADPIGLEFGPQPLTTTSSSKGVEIKNVGKSLGAVSSVSVGGTNPGDFAISGDTCTGALLKPGASCGVGVTFTPGALGSRRATLFVDGGVTSATVQLSGTGVVPVVADPSALSFGPWLVGTTSDEKDVTITNIGTLPEPIGLLAVTGAAQAEFSIVTDVCSGATLAPGQACFASLTFTPAAAGARSASLSIPLPLHASAATVALSGIGATSATIFPNSLSFGDLQVGKTSGSLSATVTNTGPVALLASPPKVVGVNAGDFKVTQDTCSVAPVLPAGSCTISAAFRPGAMGARSARLVVDANVVAGVLKVDLSGTGTDGSAPQSAFTTQNYAVRISGLQNVTGITTDDGTGVEVVHLRFVSILGGSPQSADAVLSCNSPRTSCSWRASLPMIPGLYRIEAFGADTAGNIEDPPASVTIVVL